MTAGVVTSYVLESPTYITIEAVTHTIHSMFYVYRSHGRDALPTELRVRTRCDRTWPHDGAHLTQDGRVTCLFCLNPNPRFSYATR